MPGITTFSRKVISLLRKIPRGKVATYGQIAKLAGNHRGSRAVAWLLHSSSRTYGLPWQRVLNAQGRISFPWGTESHLAQRRKLEQEGVSVSEQGKVDLRAYLWSPRKGRRG